MSYPGLGTHLETRFYASDGASWATGFALQEKEPSVLAENGLGGPTCVTSNVFLDVPPQYVLDLLLLEPSFDDELIVTIDGSAGTQFS